MDAKLGPGTLLLSVPQMLDPNFMHTVVLLIEHTPEGAYGLVVNRAADIAVDTLLPEHPLLSACDFPVHYGGPVGRDTLQFVHRLPDRIPGGLEFCPGLFLGGEVESMAQVAVEGERSDLRLFVGYSGWGGGQLDGELALGSWVPAESEPQLVFEDQPPEALWRKAMRGQGSAGEGLSHLPPDVSWN